MAFVKDYLSSSLPAITEVELLDIADIDINRVGLYMEAAKERSGVRICGEKAQRIADLWRKLPPGEPYRCHMPRFGVRFRSGHEVICQASICWECNNIYGNLESESFGLDFDASHATSRELLAIFKEEFGVSE